MITEEMNAENVWIEKRPHKRKFRSNILYTKCTGEGEFKNIYNTSLNAGEQMVWKGKEIHLKYIYICVCI
jgi:hypothetical protein